MQRELVTGRVLLTQRDLEMQRGDLEKLRGSLTQRDPLTQWELLETAQREQETRRDSVTQRYLEMRRDLVTQRELETRRASLTQRYLQTWRHSVTQRELETRRASLIQRDLETQRGSPMVSGSLTWAFPSLLVTQETGLR